MEVSISDEKIKDIIKPDLQRAKDWQDVLREQRKQYLLLYAMSKEAAGIKEMNRPGFSSVVSPTVYESVEGMKVGLDQLFTSPDFFAINIGDNPEAGDRVRKFVRWNIFEAQYGARELRTWLDMCLKCHYGVLKVFWDEEYRRTASEIIPEILSQDFAMLDQKLTEGWELAKFKEERASVMDAMGQSVEVVQCLKNVKLIKQEPVFIGPRLLAVDPEDFFYSPDGSELDDCRLVAHRTHKRLEDIKKGEISGQYAKGSYSKISKALEALDSGDDNEDESYRYDAADLPDPQKEENEGEVGTSFEDSLTRPSAPVELWEIYTSLDIDKDGLLEPVIICLTHDVVLSVEENPYGRPPFRVARAIEDSFKFEGKAYPASLEAIQIEHTQLTRLWNDATAMSVYGNLITSDEELMKSWDDRYVGDVLKAGSSTMQGKLYDIVKPPPLDASILKSMEVLEGRAERISGVTRYNQGIDANSLNKTATGIGIIASLSQQRQKYMANVLSETFKDAIEDIVTQLKMFGSQYLEYYVRKGNKIDVQDYANDFTVSIELGIGPQERQQQAMVLKEYVQFAASVAVPAGFANMGHVAKAMDRMGQLLNVPMEPYHYSAQELQQQEEQKQRMQAAQAQQMAQMAAIQGGMQNGEAEATGSNNAASGGIPGRNFTGSPSPVIE